MFYLIQSLIIGAVMVHNEYYHWTPNKYLAGLIGVGLAYGFTKMIWLLRTRSE